MLLDFKAAETETGSISMHGRKISPSLPDLMMVADSPWKASKFRVRNDLSLIVLRSENSQSYHPANINTTPILGLAHRRPDIEFARVVG